jgi:hypothetical protein
MIYPRVLTPTYILTCWLNRLKATDTFEEKHVPRLTSSNHVNEKEPSEGGTINTFSFFTKKKDFFVKQKIRSGAHKTKDVNNPYFAAIWPEEPHDHRQQMATQCTLHLF